MRLNRYIASVGALWAAFSIASTLRAQPEVASTYQRVGEPPPFADASFEFEFVAGSGFIEDIVVRLPSDGRFDLDSPFVPDADEFVGINPADVTARFLNGRELALSFPDGIFVEGDKAKYIMDIDGDRGGGSGMELLVSMSENRFGRDLFAGGENFATATARPVLVPAPASVELLLITAALCLSLRRAR